MQRDLVERAIAGDHDAFSELARVSIARLFAVARLILRDEARAEDATQEALVAAWRDLSSLRDPDRFEAWLRRLLVRACYREARRVRRRGAFEVHVEPIDGWSPTEASTWPSVMSSSAASAGSMRINGSCSTLHFYLGLTLAEAADALGVPAGTVKSRLHRATQAMRSALDADARPPLLIEGRPT